MCISNFLCTFATIGYPGALEEGGNEIIPTPPIIPSNPEVQTTTAIEEIYPSSLQGGEEGRLILINGQLLICHGNNWYNAAGIRVK